MKYFSLIYLLLFLLGCGPDHNSPIDTALDNNLDRESGYIVAMEPVLMPGDLEALNFTVSAPVYYRIIDKLGQSGSWQLFDKQNIKSLRLKSVQFALKEGDTPDIGDLNWSIETNYATYFQNQVISRQQWGARAAKPDMSCDNNKCKFAVHHSAGSAESNNLIVKNIQSFHMDNNKWSDIGYHFLVGIDGKCFEGRELAFQGAHVYAHNKNNIGICFLGCFDTSQSNKVETSDAMIDKMGELIGVLAAHFGIDITRETIKGHKEFKNIASLCPGDLVMARMDEIVAKAQKTTSEILAR